MTSKGGQGKGGQGKGGQGKNQAKQERWRSQEAFRERSGCRLLRSPLDPDGPSPDPPAESLPALPSTPGEPQPHGNL